MLWQSIDQRFVGGTAEFDMQLASEQQFGYQLLVLLQSLPEFFKLPAILLLFVAENFVHVGGVMQVAEIFKNPLTDV